MVLHSNVGVPRRAGYNPVVAPEIIGTIAYLLKNTSRNNRIIIYLVECLCTLCRGILFYVNLQALLITRFEGSCINLPMNGSLDVLRKCPKVNI